ncbi:hypothetical protein ACFVZJ_22445 [Streptomyces sp. NPDC058322]|uniref:hypothetical protein n=1 Tax=unclassified Streptomyces TaxID=2593676 RepID=UPI0036E3C0D7
MSTIKARAAATAAAVIVGASVSTMATASASTTALTCNTYPVGGASINYVGLLKICKSSDTQQTRITGRISGMSKVGGHVDIKIGTYRKTTSVCGVEDKTIDTGWQAGTHIISYSDGGCPSTG